MGVRACILLEVEIDSEIGFMVMYHVCVDGLSLVGFRGKKTR